MKISMNNQRGGTLLGLVLGVLLGLGAALAVAVYVTKVPVPFMNKRQPRNPDSDAAAAAAPALAGSNDPFSYFVQAGAFRTPEDAEQQRARLLLLGMQAKVSEREQSGRTVYRVRLGPFANKEEADKAKARLDTNSIETALVRVQR